MSAILDIKGKQHINEILEIKAPNEGKLGQT